MSRRGKSTPGIADVAHQPPPDCSGERPPSKTQHRRETLIEPARKGGRLHALVSPLPMNSEFNLVV